MTATTSMAVCMDGLAGLVETANLAENVYAWPAESVTPPCAVVGYPSDITFDLTFNRGGDQWVFPLWFVVGKSSSPDSRDALSDVLSDAVSIKSTLDGLQTFGDVRVTDAKIAEITIAAVTYIAAQFDCEVLR